MHPTSGTGTWAHSPIDFSFIMGATWVTLFTMALITLVGVLIAKRISARDRRRKSTHRQLQAEMASHTFPCIICGSEAHPASRCRQHIKETVTTHHVPYSGSGIDQEERDYGRL